MMSWMCPMCVCGCDSSKKAECPVTTNQDNLGLAPAGLMKMIQRVEKVVLEDRRMSAEHFASKVGISIGSVHKILRISSSITISSGQTRLPKKHSQRP